MSILVATDLSASAASGLRHAAWWASRLSLPLHVVHVSDTFGEEAAWSRYLGGDEVIAKIQERTKKRVLQHVEDALIGTDKPDSITTAITYGNPVEGVLAQAQDVDASMLVTGASSRHIVEQVVLGSTASRIVREAPMPVLVVPHGTQPGPIRKILAPVDLSQCSKSSLLKAAELAEALDAEVIVLHVTTFPFMAAEGIDVPQVMESFLEARRNELDEFVAACDEKILKVEIRDDAPASGITKAIDELEVDLVCIGTHGRKGFRKFVMGSTTERVLRKPACPVLTIRG